MMVRDFIPNPHVDRDEELRIFRRLLSGEHLGHMLLIQAGPGMGKTALLEEFYSNCEQYPRALVDLRPLDYTPAQVLGELSTELETTVKGLGGVATFPQYHAQRARLLRPGDIKIQDSRLSRVNLSASWDMHRAEQASLQIITDAFFSDLDAVLQEYARVVLMIDTFEKANIEVVQWVTGLFGEYERAQKILRGVRDRAGVRLPALGPTRVEATLILAALCEDTGQYAEARNLYQEATDDLNAEGTVEGTREDTVEATIGALAGAARAYLAQDLLREATDLYGKCLNLYSSMATGDRLLFLAPWSPFTRPVAWIRRIRATAANFPQVADGHEPDHWQLVNSLLYVQVNPESGRWPGSSPVYREVRPSALLVDLWTQVGHLYASLGDQSKAKRAAWLAHGASDALDHPWAKAEVGMLLVRLGSATGDIERRETGVELLLRVLEVARSEEDRSLELAAQLSLGDAQLAADENDLAAESFGKALELARTLGSLRNESSALVGLGRVASRAGRDEARSQFNHAIELLRKLKNAVAVADIQLELAKQEIDAGRWEAAEQLLRHALEEYEREIRPSGQARALSLMGEVAKGRRDMLKAEAYLKRAIALGAEASIPAIQITSQTSLARIHLLLRRPDEARALYAQALTLAVQADLKARQAEVLMGQGWVDYDTDIYESAKEKFGQAFEIYFRANDVGGQAEARIGQASVERRLGHPESALNLNREAVNLAERTGKRSLRIAAERAYGITLGETGRGEEALKMFQSQSPEDAGILGGLGWSLYALGRYEESIRASSAGYSRDPSQLWILHNMGLAYLANGDPVKAEEAYEEALEKTRLGDHDLGDAIRDVEHLLERRPDTQGGHDVLVMLRHWRPRDEQNW